MNSAPRWPVVLFDLDGTLLNTIDVIVASYTYAWDKVTGRQITRAEVLPGIGRTLRDVFADEAPEHADELVQVYMDHNAAHLEAMVTRYDGIAELVADLVAAGVKTGVVTSKLRRTALPAMRLAERATDLLPDWAFFVRCVLNTDELSPTASREQLVDDSALEFTRDELGRQLRRWILQLAKTRPHRFAEFLAIHQLAIKAMVLQDDELAAVVLPLLSVETSDGVMTIADLARRSPTVRYTATVDEFRQVAAVAREPLVNGGYTFESELVRRIPEVIAGTRAELIRVADLLDELDSPPLSDHAAAMGLETRAMAALAEADCQVVARIFQPADVSGLFVVDPEVLRRIERRRATDAAPAFWARVLSQVDDQLSADAAESEPSRARLCLNWTNPVVQELVRLDDDLVFDRTVKMLYVQARLAGHHPLEASDRRLLNSALTDLVQLGIARDS